LLKTLLSRWPGTPKVDLITTDGFLYPNEKLTAMGLMDKKGFPESYDTVNLLRVLTRVKAGEGSVEAPMYSHLTYDVLPGRHRVIDHPDILIVEGLNVLLPNKLGTQNSFVSDFFDFSLYVHASENDLQEWYVTRFMRLRETAFRSPDSYFHKYADISDQDAMMIARSIWKKINLANLLENILPTRARADLVLTKL
jgi:type I pantothenate kinase